jgi:hypothetical protein
MGLARTVNPVLFRSVLSNYESKHKATQSISESVSQLAILLRLLNILLPFSQNPSV